MVVRVDIHAVPLVLQRFLDLFARDFSFVHGGIGSGVSPLSLDPYVFPRYWAVRLRVCVRAHCAGEHARWADSWHGWYRHGSIVRCDVYDGGGRHVGVWAGYVPEAGGWSPDTTCGQGGILILKEKERDGELLWKVRGALCGARCDCQGCEAARLHRPLGGLSTTLRCLRGLGSSSSLRCIILKRLQCETGGVIVIMSFSTILDIRSLSDGVDPAFPSK